MRDRTLSYGMVFLAVLALVLPACSSSGVKGGVDVPKTPVGMTYMLPGGKIQLVKIEGPDDNRTMTFVLRNKSGTPLEDLTARVLFYLPPQDSEAVQAYDTDAQEVLFNSFAGEDYRITATPTLEGDIEGWKLLVKQAATVSREGEARGSLYLDNALECTKIVDRLTAMDPSLSFTVENVSGKTQELLEFRVRLTKGDQVWESPWQVIPGKIKAGATVRLTPDVSASEVSGVANVLLKIQRSVL